MIPVEETLWSQRFDRQNEDILSVTSSGVDCFTSGGESAAPFFSTLRNRLFVLFPSHQIDKNTCKYFCCIFASIKFISYWSSKVFDIVSCMQKAHWYCEWITVYVIDSFIIIFFSFCYFDVCYHQISLHCLLQVLSALRPTQFGCHVFSIFAQFAGKVSSFLFYFGHLSFLNEVVRS